MGSFGLPELVIILIIVVVLFGASKLPQIGRGFGEGIRNFRKGLKADDASSESEESEASTKS
ncbi:MAG: twin-arginine translocase TatA/TatE family subunit [Thermoanaerobaculia bacterium]